MSESKTGTEPEKAAEILQESDAPLVSGSLWRAIWIMSWPLLVTTVTYSIVGMTDLYVAGKLGSAHQAAVGLSEQIMFMFTLFIMATGTGTTALVSRYWGAGDRSKARRYSGQSLALALTLGILLLIVAQIIGPLAIQIFTQTAEVQQLGIMYIRLFSFYILPFCIVCIGNCSFRAIGDAKTPLLVVCTMALIQITGDILTVMYAWPVPNLGIRGIAFSALVAAFCGSMIALFRIVRSPLAKSLSHVFPVVRMMIKKIVAIGIPSALQRMSWSLSVFGLFFILSLCPAPTETLAAWAVGMRVEGLMFMPVMALSMAVASIVGQNLGARELERAYQAGWQVTWIGVGLLTVMAVVLFLMAEPVAAVMSENPTTRLHVISYLQINAVSEPFLALAMILGGALQGAGDTRTPMWITIFTNWIIRLPLAYVLAISMNMGPSGAWWSMTLSMVGMGFLTAWQFKSRRWMKLHL